jgi:pyruvate/2-oxoglutarate dehydrogenase complex dihydrolipoamide acyltransferase (E2) component
MATPVHTPRVNNNDDTVRLTRVLVERGAPVRAGDIVAEVETDKANFTVEADRDGFVLSIAHQIDQVVRVGSVLLWLGATPDETPPALPAGTEGTSRQAGEPTLKAAQLLAKYALRADDVPASGDRLSARDVEAFVAARGLAPAGQPVNGHVPPGDVVPAPERAWPAPASGRRRALTPEERGMLNTVLWHRDEAVPGYVELEYDLAPWEQVAAEYQRREKLMLSPLLSLMAYRLARLAAEHDSWNATMVGDERLVFDAVNLGFTVQSESMLYLVVVADAASLTAREFVDRLGQLQRAAFGRKLQSHELSGATVSFSSMARWPVTRHVPVLPPHTSLIVAHAAGSNGRGTLGATYDHRVLTGFDALSAIRAVSAPEGLT